MGPGGSGSDSGGTSLGNGGGASSDAGGAPLASGGAALPMGGTTSEGGGTLHGTSGVGASAGSGGSLQGTGGSSVVTPSDGCYAIQSRPDVASPEYTRYAYDEAARILNGAVVTTPEASAPPVSSQHYRIDSEKRLLTYASRSIRVEDRNRLDYVRDTAGNVTSRTLVYEDWTDLTQPATKAPDGYDAFTHTYDERGLLVQSIQVASSHGTNSIFAYTHDEAGRCLTRTTYQDASMDPAIVARYSYTDGRISEVATDIAMGSGVPAQHVVTHYRYDDAGRLLAAEQDGGGDVAGSADGILDNVAYFTYEPDGSWRYESADCTAEVSNGILVINGVERACYRIDVAYSRGCSQLAARLPKATTGFDCRFELAGQLPL